MREKHVLERLTEIINDLKSQDLETITELLNYYNGKPVEIEGVTYHPYNDPVLAAKINARYKELTGENHSRFVEEAPKVIEGLLEDKDMLLQAEAYPEEYFEKLEDLQRNLSNEESIMEEPTMEELETEEPVVEEPSIDVSKEVYPEHILSRKDSIVADLSNANLEDVSQLLDYYNGKPVEIEGVTYHPYNDPVLAAKINARYKELTGENHSRFVEEAPKVIEGLLEDKDMLLQAEAYPEEYFEQLEGIIQNVNSYRDKEKSSVGQTYIVSREDVVEKAEELRISDIKEGTINLKEEVRQPEEPTVDRNGEARA